MCDNVRKRDLGILLTADGMIRLAPGVVRIPDAEEIHLYTSTGDCRKFTAAANDALDAGDLLPGFRLALREFFVKES